MLQNRFKLSWILLIVLFSVVVTSLKYDIMREQGAEGTIDSFKIYENNTQRHVFCRYNESAIFDGRNISCVSDATINERGCPLVKGLGYVFTASHSGSSTCILNTLHRKKDGNLEMLTPVPDLTLIQQKNTITINYESATSSSSSLYGYLLKVPIQCTGNGSDICITFTTPLTVNKTTTTHPPVTTMLSNTTTLLTNASTTQTAENSTQSTTSPPIDASTDAHTTPLNMTKPESHINVTTVPTRRTSLNASVSANDMTTEKTTRKGNASISTAPSGSRHTSSISNTVLATDSPAKSDKMVIVLSVLGATIVMLILIICLVYLLYCKRKREKRSEDSLIAMAPLEDDDVFSSTIPDDLYSKVNKKKKRKSCFSHFGVFSKVKSKPNNWSGYDEVGALIEGTYEARESSTAVEPDSKYGVSALYVQNSKPDSVKSVVVQDQPYEMIGRANSFTPGRLKKNGNTPVDNIRLTETSLAPPDSEDEPSEMSLKSVEDLNRIPTVSTFKAGGSVRMKQQRTSMKKGREKDKALATHEDVRITPRSSLDKLDKISRGSNEIKVPSTNKNEINVEKNSANASSENANDCKKSNEKIDKKSPSNESINATNTEETKNIYEELNEESRSCEMINNEVTKSNENLNEKAPESDEKDKRVNDGYEDLTNIITPIDSEKVMQPVDKDIIVPTAYADVEIMPVVNDVIKKQNGTDKKQNGHTSYTEVSISD